ncbi:MAG: lysoplasmalogenase family protein, partial [Candidatus Cryptobacteroides sp.]
IGSMLFAALMQRSILYAVAAVLFVFSDMVIAWNSFISPVPNERYVIMVTYYLAQLLFYLRAAGLKVGKELGRYRL